jgi:quercetin dioxygenase-like cupin family protein
MKRQSTEANLDRRALLLSGLAGATTLVVTKGSSVLAAEPPKGVKVNVIKETTSRIKGVSKVQLIEVTLEPGAIMPTSKMDTAMICECTRGSLEVTLDEGKKVTMNKGGVWTCGVGTDEGVANKGNTAAIMRVFNMVA